jgi:4-carboxymuconolactone decarboxylase
MSIESRQLGVELQRRMLGPSFNSPTGEGAVGFASEFISEHVFGELWQRLELDLRTRSLCTVAALAATRSPMEALRNHIHGALANGATESEISEVLVHTAFYTGLPILGSVMRAAKEVFDGEWSPRSVGQ